MFWAVFSLVTTGIHNWCLIKELQPKMFCDILLSCILAAASWSNKTIYICTFTTIWLFFYVKIQQSFPETEEAGGQKLKSPLIRKKESNVESTSRSFHDHSPFIDQPLQDTNAELLWGDKHSDLLMYRISHLKLKTRCSFFKKALKLIHESLRNLSGTLMQHLSTVLNAFEWL